MHSSLCLCRLSLHACARQTCGCDLPPEGRRNMPRAWPSCNSAPSSLHARPSRLTTFCACAVRSRAGPGVKGRARHVHVGTRGSLTAAVRCQAPVWWAPSSMMHHRQQRLQATRARLCPTSSDRDLLCHRLARPLDSCKHKWPDAALALSTLPLPRAAVALPRLRQEPPCVDPAPVSAPQRSLVRPRCAAREPLCFVTLPCNFLARTQPPTLLLHHGGALDPLHPARPLPVRCRCPPTAV
jgi:hypothetical protein